MKIYLFQYTDENKKPIGTPILTASEETINQAIEYARKNNVNAYSYVYDVKTQGKNFNNYAYAEYHNETEEPF